MSPVVPKPGVYSASKPGVGVISSWNSCETESSVRAGAGSWRGGRFSYSRVDSSKLTGLGCGRGG
jgi:hypothetical protein